MPIVPDFRNRCEITWNPFKGEKAPVAPLSGVVFLGKKLGRKPVNKEAAATFLGKVALRCFQFAAP